MYFTGVSTPSWRMRSAVLWMNLDQLKQTLVFKMKKKNISFDGLEKAGGVSNDTDTELAESTGDTRSTNVTQKGR
jgi:hypothetical protein